MSDPKQPTHYEIAGEHEVGDTTRAYMKLDCGQACSIPLRKGAPKGDGVNTKVWGWDGKGTVSPSINCPVCGFHKTLVNGEWA